MSAIQSVPENVANGLQSLRNEQRALANKLSELQMDLNEHNLVIETLDKVEKDRRCFRLVGGVLVERKVGEVEPALVGNRGKVSYLYIHVLHMDFSKCLLQLSKLIETLEKQLTEKGGDINAYIEKHNIQIQGRKDQSSANVNAQAADSGKPSTSGVLVSSGGSDATK